MRPFVQGELRLSFTDSSSGKFVTGKSMPMVSRNFIIVSWSYHKGCIAASTVEIGPRSGLISVGSFRA